MYFFFFSTEGESVTSITPAPAVLMGCFPHAPRSLPSRG